MVEEHGGHRDTSHPRSWRHSFERIDGDQQTTTVQYDINSNSTYQVSDIV